MSEAGQRRRDLSKLPNGLKDVVASPRDQDDLSKREFGRDLSQLRVENAPASIAREAGRLGNDRTVSLDSIYGSSVIDYSSSGSARLRKSR